MNDFLNGIDIEKSLREKLKIKMYEVINRAYILSTGKCAMLIIDNHENQDQREIMVFISPEEITRDDTRHPLAQISINEDLDGIVMSGALILKDIINQARLLSQRCIFIALIRGLVQAKALHDKVSEEQLEAIKNLKEAYDKNNIFKIPGERYIIFREVIAQEQGIKSVNELRDDILNNIRWQFMGDNTKCDPSQISVQLMMQQVLGF